MDEVLKLWGGLGSVVGILVGAFVTYFFTQDQVRRQESQIKTIEAAFQASEQQKRAAGQQALQLATGIKWHGDWINVQQAAESLESIATKLIPEYAGMAGMINESPRPSPSAHATVPNAFHDLFKRNTPPPSPSGSP
jgi:hypothetical protein